MRASPSQNNISMRQSAKKNKNITSNQNTVLPKINNVYQRKVEDTSFNLDNNLSYKNLISVNDPEEENLKEITALMKKILNE